MTRATFAAGYLFVIAVLLVDALLVAASVRTILRSYERVDNARQVVAELEHTLAILKDAETGQRGFLLTGRDSYLEPLHMAEARFNEGLGRLERLTKENARQRDLIADLRVLTAVKMAELRQTVEIRRAQGLQDALEVVLTDRDREVMERIVRVAADFRGEEDRLLVVRTAAARQAVRRLVLTFSATTGAAIILLFAVFLLQWLEGSVREKAESALKRSEAWLSTTLASIGDAVIASDDHGRVRLMNPVASGLTGWRPDEAAGQPMDVVFTIIDEATRQPSENPVGRVIEEGRTLAEANPTLLVAKDGTETSIENCAAPIKDEDGKIVGVVLVFRDTTERRRQDAFRDEQRRLAEFGRDMGFALSGEGTLPEILGRCTQLTVGRLDATFSGIWTVAELGRVELQASTNVGTEAEDAHHRVLVGEPELRRMVEDGHPYLSNDVPHDPDVPASDWAGREGIVAFAGFPLVADGEPLGLWVTYSRHAFSEATLFAMASVARVIALGVERKTYTQALTESSAWLSTTLASIGDAVIATDELGRVRFMNPVAESLTGWSQDEAAGRPLLEIGTILEERTRQVTPSPIERVIREGAGVGFADHSVMVARDGQELPIEVNAALIREGSGRVSGVVMVFRDVTERRRQEDAVRRSEDRLRLAIESGKLGTWEMDPALGTVLCDDRSRALLGFSADDPVDYGVFLSAVHPDDRPTVDQTLRAAIEPSVAGELDLEFRTVGLRDGVERWLSSRGRRSFAGAGRSPRLSGTILDVTDKKRGQDELRLAKEAAEDANRAKDQFLAVLSHELRTPLNPILLAVTSMLERSEGAEEFRTNLEMIRQYVGLQARLIDDLLDVMRIVRGKMPFHWEVTDCNQLIDRAVEVCRSELLGKELRLELDVVAQRRHVNADPARLQQVLWNLVKNAVKFTPQAGLITIRTRNRVDEAAGLELIVFEVEDTGIGIDPAILSTIFDPFQQGEVSITRKFGGLGLGLAISKGIIEGHGGVLTAESAGHGQGATFRIELQTLTSPGPDDSEASERPADSSESTPLVRRKILLVEDEPATLRLLARLLRGLGHEVTATGTITSALEAEAEGDFDLIISDIGLPDGSGLRLMQQVVARRGPVSAIALTGYGMEEDIRQSRDAGFLAHMTKPIDFIKLQALIRQMTS